ncbi:MAG: YeeE/YedE family protein, partial [Halorhabdus sp.]
LKPNEIENVTFARRLSGLGWGISGVCPGSGYASLGIGNWPILIAIAGMFVGAYLQGIWRDRTT